MLPWFSYAGTTCRIVFPMCFTVDPHPEARYLCVLKLKHYLCVICANLRWISSKLWIAVDCWMISLYWVRTLILAISLHYLHGMGYRYLSLLFWRKLNELVGTGHHSASLFSSTFSLSFHLWSPVMFSSIF